MPSSTASLNPESQLVHLEPPSNPLVTAIVLSYNQSQFILETLESVRAQSYATTELIIVDDCSSDKSVAIVEEWIERNAIACTFIKHQQNRGICKSLNDALAVANGKYVSMVASDDIWLPDKIERQVQMIEAQPDSVGVLYSDAFQINEGGFPLPEMFIATHRSLPEMPQGDVLTILFGGNFIPGMTTLIRRSCYDHVGLYDVALPWEDWDMWMRIAQRYSFIYSPTPSAMYRVHQNSLSHSDPKRMLKDSLIVCLKQFRSDSVNKNQRSILIGTLLYLSEELYKVDEEASLDTFKVLARTTRDKKATWMYRCAKLGISFDNWQRLKRYRAKIRHLRARLAYSISILLGSRIAANAKS